MKKLIQTSLLFFISVLSFGQSKTSSTVSPTTNVEKISETKAPRNRDAFEKSVTASAGEYIIMDNTSSFTILPGGMKGNKTPGSNHIGTNTIYGEDVMVNIQNAASYNVGVGKSALNRLTTGDYNTALGYALNNNTKGSENVAIGDLSLTANTTASKNIAIGARSLDAQSFDNGDSRYDLNNIAIGFESLNQNNPTSLTTGDRNIGLGNLSLRNNTIGRWNLAIGTNSQFSNTTGNFNLAIGDRALEDNVAGDHNLGIGLNALANTTAGENVALGNNSLFSNTSGTANLALGNGALFFSQGDYNVAIGNSSQLNNGYASRNVSIGFNSLASQNFANTNVKYNTDNVAVGYHALRLNDPTTTSNGVKNIAIGSFAADNNRTGTSNIAIGQNALGANLAGSQNIAIGEGSLNSSTNSSNTAVGIDAGYLTLGDNNTFLGRASGYTNTSGSGNVYLGFAADASASGLSNSVAVGFQAVVNASNKVRIGNGSITVIEGAVPFSVPSDRRLKENFNYESIAGLEFIKKLKPVSYNYISDQTKVRHDGFIAQEVEATMKELNAHFSGLKKSPDGTYSLAYSDFVMPLVKAIQEQQKIIDNKALKINQLEARLSAIEASLKSTVLSENTADK
jgi:trimeric autotransporter adhesin